MKNCIRIFSLVLALACALSASAVSRQHKLQINVTDPSGTLKAGQQFSLLCVPYAVYYPTNETVLDADGRCSIMVYPGEHELSLAVEGMDRVERSFTVDGDLSVDIVLGEKVVAPYSLDYYLDHNIFTGNNRVTFSWNGDEVVFFDDFEDYDPFALAWGDWKGIDADGKFADVLTGEYGNSGLRNYGQIMNPLAVKPIWDIKYYWTLTARSGNQYVGFVQNNDASANNDWVITPEITITDDNVLRFYVKSADRTDARFTVGITEVENPTAADFKLIQQGNYINAPYDRWTEVVIPLTQYAGHTVRIGINCISAYGTVMSMLDDVFVGRIAPDSKAPARRVAERPFLRSAANPNESFVVTLDGAEVARTDEYFHTFDNMPYGHHTLGVKAVYNTSESSETTLNMAIETDSYVEAAFNVTTNTGVTVDKAVLRLVSPSSSHAINIVDGMASAASMPVGTYMASIEFPDFDSYESEVTISAASPVVDIVLKETITKPFNITHDVTATDDAGNFDVTLKWNQYLGFYDGFEDYDDFATEFGEWVTYDFNTQPSYPIALGSLSNEVTFPGASTVANRVPVPPMVFNPSKTTPSLAVDEAFAAVFGDKFIMFQGPANAAADKWVISPVIDIHDNYELSVIAKAYSIYPESIELCVSAGSVDPADFQVLDVIDLDYEQWSKYVIDLNSVSGRSLRFGVHCTSYDGFVCQVDEFNVGRQGGESENANTGKVLGFDLWLDGAKIGSSTDNSFTLHSVAAGEHTLEIAANYASGASERTVYTFIIDASGITDITADSADAVYYNLQGIKVSKPTTGFYIESRSTGAKVIRR